MKTLIRIGCLAFLLIFTLSAHQTLAATIHVPADYATIQGAIDAAVDGDLVLVAPGVYVENIDFLGKAITLQSEAGADVTIIDGGSCTTGDDFCSVVTFSSGEMRNSVLDGFTLTGGTGRYIQRYLGFVRVQIDMGGGAFCLNASPTIKNCIITDNHLWADVPGPYFDELGGTKGGGIYCQNASPNITNCMIVGNSVDGTCWAGYEGTAMYCNPRSAPKITHCTISGNNATAPASSISASPYTVITNCILWDDDPIGGTPQIRYSDVNEVWPPTGIGNINEDPLFVDPENGDYHLSKGSPCINAGIFAWTFKDIDGQQRPFGPGFDMGADEFDRPSWPR